MSDRAREGARMAARPPNQGSSAAPAVRRLMSEDLFQQLREIEIDHEGRIYRLRMTQLNKLILTA